MSTNLLRLLFFLTVFFLVTRFNLDPDFGWHVAYGEKFLETGKVIRADEFSWTMPGYVWGNYFAGYQILSAFILNKLGYLFLVIFFGIIVSFSFLILLPRKLGFAQILVGLAGAAVTVVTVRPSAISFLMIAVLLFLLEFGVHKKLASLFFWFLFFSFWANFHQGFVLGLVILAAFSLFDYLFKRKIKTANNEWPRVLVFLVSLFGTFFTPYNFLLWKGIILDLAGFRTWTGIAEWRPTVVNFPDNIFLLITAIPFVYLLFKKFKNIDPVWFLTAISVFIWAFVFTHSVPFWTEIFVFVVSRNVKFDLKGSFIEKFPIYFVLASVFAALALNFLIGVIRSYNLIDRLKLDGYPVEAAKYIIENRLEQGVFNDYGWGGFLDWQYPQIKVFIDGRMTGWRTKESYILNDYIRIIKGDCNLVEKYQIKTALIKKDADAICFSNYLQVYEDKVAKILTKN